MLPLAKMPRLPGFDTPEDLYCVTLEPAPLFGMPYPSGRLREDWSALFDAGARGVLCLADERPRYDPAPLALIGAVDLQDLVSGGPPRDAVLELGLVREQAELVLTKLARREGVVVHCAGGRGRTGTILGCVLVRLGHEPAEVIAYLDALHQARGRSGWPESEWQSETVRGARAW